MGWSIQGRGATGPGRTWMMTSKKRTFPKEGTKGYLGRQIKVYILVETEFVPGNPQKSGR